jgi:hypothetical protein
VALAPLLLAGGCEPIAAPQPPDNGAVALELEVGAAIPPFGVINRTGERLASANLFRGVTLLTFVVPAAEQPAMLFARVDDALDRLGDDAADLNLVAVELPGLRQLASHPTRHPWNRVAGSHPEELTRVAARLGVLAWHTHEDTAMQTLGLAVVRPDGTLHARFGGLATWAEIDLVAAIVGANN